MPAVQIEVRQQYDLETESALMDAVHSALVEAFKIPQHDRNIRLFVHAPHRFLCPTDKSQPEYFTLISIDCFAGRSLGAKRHLYQSMVRNLSSLGIPADHINILLRELPTENWGIRGGQAACDVSLGFDIEV
ncbi:tautomerase family protein [Acinetobacter piscicola]|uniref:tautomerase family protein n=1 Tax=Acinetobacter piscicola TaxID=2006115 RepID=UPI000B7E6C02|nr:tautomerase family protein [Acinetobacter piscicola]